MILKTANIWLFFYAANLKQILFKNIFVIDNTARDHATNCSMWIFIIAKQRLDWLIDIRPCILFQKFDLGQHLRVSK